MMLGLAHVGLDVVQPAAAVAAMRRLGWREQVRDRVEIRAPDGARTRLELVLLDTDDALPIEICDVASPISGGCHELSLGRRAEPGAGVCGDPAIADALQASGCSERPLRIPLPGIRTQVWFEAGGGPSTGMTIVVPSPDVAAAAAFWAEFLRCSRIGGTHGWSRHRVSTPLGRRSGNLLVVKAEPARNRPASADTRSIGSSLAFVSTTVDGDLIAAVHAGGRVVMEPRPVAVDGVELVVAFLATPDGHLVELVQPAPMTPVQRLAGADQ